MSNTRKAKDVLLGKGKRPERTVAIYLRGDLVAAIEQAERELIAARDGWQRTKMSDVDPARDIAERLEAMREEMKASQVVLILRAIGAKQRSDLITAHQSTSPGMRFSADTLFPALVHASCVDPEFESPDEAAQFLDEIGSAQAAIVSNAAWELASDPLSVPFSVAASVLTQDSERK